MSNKEYNFFIMYDTVIWKFISVLFFSKILQLPWIHFASLLSKALSYRAKVKKASLYLYL